MENSRRKAGKEPYVLRPRNPTIRVTVGSTSVHRDVGWICWTMDFVTLLAMSRSVVMIMGTARIR